MEHELEAVEALLMLRQGPRGAASCDPSASAEEVLSEP